MATSASPTSAPPRAPRRPLAPRIRFVVALLATLAVFAAVVGMHDVIVPSYLQVRIVASLLTFGAVVLASAAWAIGRRRRRAYPLGVAGCAVGALICVLLALSQLAASNVGWLFPVTLAGAAGSLAGIAILRRAVPKAYRRVTIRELPLLGPSISLAIAISLLQFWYTTIYQPSTSPPSVTVSVSLTKAGARAVEGRTDLLISGTVKLENETGQRVNTTGSLYVAEGVSLTPADGEQLTAAMPSATWWARGPARRFAVQAGPELLEYGRLVDDGLWMEAGEAITIPIELVVPRGRYDVVHLQASIGCARATLDMEDEPLGHANGQPPAPPAATSGAVVYTTAVSGDSWLGQLTRGQQYVRATYGTDLDAYTFEAEITRHTDRADDEPYARAMRRLYGLAYTSSGDSLALAGADGSGEAAGSTRPN